MKRSFFIIFVTLLVVAGCGGGGSKNGGGNQPSAMIPITSTNAVDVTKSSYQAALASASLGELTGETGFIAGGSIGVSKVGDVVGASNKFSSGQNKVDIPPTESLCDFSGSVIISGKIKDFVTPTLSKGDFFDIEFKMCSDVQGETTNGDLHFDVDAFTGDFLGGLFNMTMILGMDNFQVTTGEDVVTINGEATVMLNTLNTPAVSVSVSGSSMTVDANASSETLFDFMSAQTLNAGVMPSPYTTTASGTLDTTQLAGSVRYSTPVMFEGFDNDYPGTGQLLVTGDASTARLVAESNVNVRIEIDTDGNGSIDETINTTWAELAAP